MDTQMESLQKLDSLLEVSIEILHELNTIVNHPSHSISINFNLLRLMYWAYPQYANSYGPE